MIEEVGASYQKGTDQFVRDEFSAPFKNNTEDEVIKHLRNMIERTESKIDRRYLIILDKRTEEDETAVLIDAQKPDTEGTEVCTVRSEFAFTARALSAASVLHPSLGEQAETAEETGAVIRQ